MANKNKILGMCKIKYISGISIKHQKGHRYKTNKKPNQAQNYKKDYNKWIMEITSV